MTMMPLRSMPLVLWIVICCLLAGCARKKPVLVMPQEPPPATAPTPAPTPAAESKQEPAQPEVSPTPAPAETPSTAAAEGTKAKPHPTPKKSPHANGTTTARNNPKTVVEAPPDVAPNIPPPPSPEALSQQQATEQLLQSTETAIKGINRQLSKEDQAILAQIKDFISQSRAAMQGNDFVRARNLAQKAHLLSDELVKQK
jgi:hypothetical protein